MNLLDAAFPGKIAGVHLAGLASGENRYACPPEDYGYADYSAGMANDYCGRVTRRQASDKSDRGEINDVPHSAASRSGSQPRANASCAVPTAQDRCNPPSGNIFVSNDSASFNMFLSHQV